MDGNGALSLAAAVLRQNGERLLDVLLPPQCLGCGIVVDGLGRLCPGCWDGIDFIAPPYCDACGFPFEFDLGPGSLCGACSREPPPWHRARAVMRYDAASRDLVLGFKHGDRTHGAPAYGRWLARAGADLIADAELIVPVPLHWLRLLARRYNQAALLARALAGTTGVPVVPDLMVRRKRTQSQGHLTRAARLANVRGAFAIAPRRAALARGRRVLLVDDVLTTGATIRACSRALLRSGARAVDVLVLARTGGGVALDR